VAPIQVPRCDWPVAILRKDFFEFFTRLIDDLSPADLEYPEFFIDKPPNHFDGIVERFNAQRMLEAIDGVDRHVKVQSDFPGTFAPADSERFNIDEIAQHPVNDLIAEHP
jgi:hypothetical protein